MPETLLLNSSGKRLRPFRLSFPFYHLGRSLPHKERAISPEYNKFLTFLSSFLSQKCYYISMNEIELREMIADYMEKGFLENIIDMFKHDSELYYMVGDLMKDQRIRVRLGVTALVETLSKEDNGNIKKAIPGLIKNLNEINPVIRGDAAYLLGFIGEEDSIPFLLPLLNDVDNNVREIARDSIIEIENRN